LKGNDVPTYQYQCTECGNSLEVRQSFTDDALTVCPNCEGALRKVFNAVGVVFKGSGFYRTDSRSAGTSTVPAKSEAASSSSSSDSSSSSGGSSSVLRWLVVGWLILGEFVLGWVVLVGRVVKQDQRCLILPGPVDNGARPLGRLVLSLA